MPSPHPQIPPAHFSLHLADETRSLEDFWNRSHYLKRTSQLKDPELSPGILKLECAAAPGLSEDWDRAEAGSLTPQIPGQRARLSHQVI